MRGAAFQFIKSASFRIAIQESLAFPRKFQQRRHATLWRSAGFQTCRVADTAERVLATCSRSIGVYRSFQIGRHVDLPRLASLETCDTADLEVCATLVAALLQVYTWLKLKLPCAATRVGQRIEHERVIRKQGDGVAAPRAQSAQPRPRELQLNIISRGAL